MENTINFEVKEASLQEFAEKYFVNNQDPMDLGRREIQKINPYYLLGKGEIIARATLLDVIKNDLVVVFTLSDRAETSRKSLVNTYTYSIEKYDDVCLKLELIDFKVEVQK